MRLGSKWWEGRHEGSWKVYDKSRCITVEVQIIAVPILLKNDPILLAFPKLVPCSCTIVMVIYHFMGDCSRSSSVWLLRIVKRISNNFHLWPMNFFTSYIPNSLYSYDWDMLLRLIIKGCQKPDWCSSVGIEFQSCKMKKF